MENPCDFVDPPFKYTTLKTFSDRSRPLEILIENESEYVLEYIKDEFYKGTLVESKFAEAIQPGSRCLTFVANSSMIFLGVSGGVVYKVNGMNVYLHIGFSNLFWFNHTYSVCLTSAECNISWAYDKANNNHSKCVVFPGFKLSGNMIDGMYCPSKRIVVTLESDKAKKPLIAIYVWKGSGSASVGHASMTLSDGTHISWWPTDKNLKKKSRKISALTSPAYLSQDLEEDISKEEYQPDETYYFPAGSIDETAIKEWWARFRSSEQYRVLDQNCCHVVFRALETGRAWELITDENVRSQAYVVLTPTAIDTLVQKIHHQLCNGGIIV